MVKKGTIGVLNRTKDDARYVMEWCEPVKDRFKVGDRVVFSHWADRNGLTWRTKGGVRSGTVEAISGTHTVMVRLDGYKRPSRYHHMFFYSSKGGGALKDG
jgi:hypothetical protein